MATTVTANAIGSAIGEAKIARMINQTETDFFAFLGTFYREFTQYFRGSRGGRANLRQYFLFIFRTRIIEVLFIIADGTLDLLLRQPIQLFPEIG